MTVTPFLPDTDLLLMELLRPAVAAEVGTEIPADLADRLPYLTAKRISGGDIHPRFADHPTIDVQSWAATLQEASLLARTAEAVLYLAWYDQTVTSHGHLGWYQKMSGPSELRTEGQLDNVFRFQASYELIIRPVLSPAP